jgi:SAM-dependent methyltransferase
MAITAPHIVGGLLEVASPDARILEVGCGDKGLREVLPGTYVGLDLPDSSYLDEPPDLAGSAEDIPAEDQTFDLVFGVAVFVLITDVDRAFRECLRVLRPGGHLLVFDYQKAVSEQLAVSDPERHRRAWDSAELCERIRAAGFVDVRDRSSLVDTADGPSLALLARRRIRRAMGAVGTWLIVEARRPS